MESFVNDSWTQVGTLGESNILQWKGEDIADKFDFNRQLHLIVTTLHVRMALLNISINESKYK